MTLDVLEDKVNRLLKDVDPGPDFLAALRVYNREALELAWVPRDPAAQDESLARKLTSLPDVEAVLGKLELEQLLLQYKDQMKIDATVEERRKFGLSPDVSPSLVDNRSHADDARH
jgi:hypothetical protein